MTSKITVDGLAVAANRMIGTAPKGSIRERAIARAAQGLNDPKVRAELTNDLGMAADLRLLEQLLK